MNYPHHTLHSCSRASAKIHGNVMSINKCGTQRYQLRQRAHDRQLPAHYGYLLWARAPAQRKRATMLYFANVFIYLFIFFMATLFSGPG